MISTKYPIERFLSADATLPIAKQLSDVLTKTVDDFVARFGTKDEAWASRKPAPDKWSAKEILGHLLDSAANNHQRFVRAQYLDDRRFPGYEQMEWVALQHCNERTWSNLILFWRSFNLHIAHVIVRLSASDLQKECTVGSGTPEPLEWIATDYVGHIQHHIKQIEAR
jgi:hypothetical protein